MNTYQRLTNEIDSLIKTEGRTGIDGYSLDWTDLDESDQNKVVALFLDYDDRDLFSIYENEKYDDIVCSLLTMLSKDARDSDQDFAECLKKNLVRYYAKRAQELIEERCAEVEAAEHWEHNQVKRQDRNTGEYYWSTI